MINAVIQDKILNTQILWLTPLQKEEGRKPSTSYINNKTIYADSNFIMGSNWRYLCLNKQCKIQFLSNVEDSDVCCVKCGSATEKLATSSRIPTAYILEVEQVVYEEGAVLNGQKL